MMSVVLIETRVQELMLSPVLGRTLVLRVQELVLLVLELELEGAK